MLFEWDQIKSQRNKKKHGVSFAEAEVIWEQTYLEVEGIARSLEGEARNATMGWIEEEIYVAIWTQREGKVRLISVRKARKYEKEIFLKGIQNQ